jgi:hypothetical protein
MSKKRMIDMIPKPIKVLLYYSEDEKSWIAQALEMSLCGYGRTKGKAYRELWDLVKAQVSFADFMKNPKLLDFPSDNKYHKRYKESRPIPSWTQAILIKGKKDIATGMPMPGVEKREWIFEESFDKCGA